MKKKIWWISSIVILFALAVYFFFYKDGSNSNVKFTFAKISHGDISITITSTGTLEALSTVDVGTQVSGRIDKIFADFNDNVRKGQILAILDTTNLALQVSNAKTGLQKAVAQNELAKTQFKNDKTLYDKGFISELEYITSKSNYETAEANLNSAKASLAQAKTNLGYAFIYSPIKGKIINRNVEEGQTVAASLSAPTLFTIAEDLSKMRILADVDESDIGQIKVGQDAQFTVQAYPEKQFSGKVVQIRLGSKVVSNVVNYTVVIDAENNDGLLLPGMTATIDFYVEKRENVAMIPNAALRFQPPDQIKNKYLERIKKERENMPDSLKREFRRSNNFGRLNGQKRNFENSSGITRGTFWCLDKEGKPTIGYAVLGISDGKNTEIIRSRELKEGQEVIVRTTTEETAQKNNSNIFSPNRNMPRPPRRGF